MRRLTEGPRYLAGALLLGLLAAPNLFGQDHDIRVTVFGGGSFVKADRSFLLFGEAFRTSFANGGKFGARVTGDFHDHWSAEGTYSYGTNNFRMADLSTTPPSEFGFGVRVQQLTGDILYFFNPPGRAIRPFLTAGVGWERFSPTDAARAEAVVARQVFPFFPAPTTASDAAAFSFGAGLEGKFSRALGWRADFRDVLTSIPRFGFSKPLFPVTGTAQDLEVSLGLVFHFKK